MTDDTVNKEWGAFMAAMAPMGERIAALMVDPEDPRQRQDVYRTLFSGISNGYMGMLIGDRSHPDFWPWLSNAHSFLASNPDAVYYLAAVDGDGIYEISGYPGTVRLADIQVSAGGPVPPHGTGHFGPTFANYNPQALPLDASGAFTAILSAERPAGYTGNWLPLDRRATYVLIRQFAYDWLNEVDGRYAIQRLDTPAVKPRLTAQQTQENLELALVWGEAMARICLDRPRLYLDKGLVNKLMVNEQMGEGGIAGQQYMEGIYALEDDEALIIETDVPETCRYWNLQLADMVWVCIDYVNRQSHLNGHTARIDSDGRFRAVISTRDPGVANWLDCSGYNKGTIMGRWTQCSSYPVPTLTKVKLADVRNHLPADTPTVTVEERDGAIRLRRKGAQLRRRW